MEATPMKVTMTTTKTTTMMMMKTTTTMMNKLQLRLLDKNEERGKEWGGEQGG